MNEEYKNFDIIDETLRRIIPLKVPTSRVVSYDYITKFFPPESIVV